MSPEEIKAKAERAEGKKPAKPQGAGGRPPSYKAPFAKQAEKLCALGTTDEDLADFFEVNVGTISRWKVQHEEFCQALKAGKTEADDRVERALYQKAVGYTVNFATAMNNSNYTANMNCAVVFGRATGCFAPGGVNGGSTPNPVAPTTTELRVNVYSLAGTAGGVDSALVSVFIVGGK